MVLTNGKEEFELTYTIGAIIRLKGLLACENLRNTLLIAANKEDYAVLAKALKEFSGGKLSNVESAYSCMDAYMAEHSVSAYEMFLQFITEAGEAGFFKEKKTLEQIRELAASPELQIDMEEMMSEALQRFKGKALDDLVESFTTGANTSIPSVPALTRRA